MQQEVVGVRMGLSVGIAQVEVFATAAAKAAVLEAERLAQVAAGAPADVRCRPTRLSELLVTDETSRARVHAVLRDVADAQAQLHALQAAAISRLAQLQPAQGALPGARGDDPADPDRPDDWVADEVAVVLGISVGSASSLVDKQRALAEQLPRVWEALADGGIDVRRAQVLVDALAHRKQSFGGGLADDVVDDIARQGLGWIAEGIGPTTLTDRIGGALIAADPAEAARRAERRKRKQNVTSTGCGDGLATLRAELVDAADVAEELEVIDALAASMRKGGDQRPLGQLRVAAHHQLLTRPWETLPAEVAAARWHLRVQVDLADLDDLGPVGALGASAPASGDAQANPPEDPATNPETGTRPQREPAPAAPTDGAEPEDEEDLPPSPAPAPADRACPPSTPGSAAHPDRSSSADGDGNGVHYLAPAGTGVGSGVGAIGGLPVSPVAVAELLARYDALMATGPGGRVEGGDVWFEILDATGRLRALTSPAEARAALRRGTGLGPPPVVEGYVPSAAQVRFVRARDQHCRFPGCARPAEYADLDHVIPRDHHNPAAGGPTCITNLVCLCRRHHRLKTHAPGWMFAMDPDGTLHVTPPGGRTRTTRPDRIAQVDMSTPTHLDTLTDLLGPTPHRFRSPTPEQRAARRAAAADRARLAAEIEAELDAALARLTTEREGARDETAERGGSRDETTQDKTDHDETAEGPAVAEEDPPPF